MATNLGLDDDLDGLNLTDSAVGQMGRVVALLDKLCRSTKTPLGDLAKLDSVVGVPTGSTVDYVGDTAPTGWLLCNGQSVSRATYADLFALMGTKFGGSGANFNLPDTRRRLILGAGGTVPAGTNGPANTVGATGGDEQIVLSAQQLAAHTHDDGTLAAASAGAHAHKVADLAGSSSGNPDNFPSRNDWASTRAQNTAALNTGSAGAHTHDVTGATGSTGAGANVPIMPPVLVLAKIIKT